MVANTLMRAQAMDTRNMLALLLAEFANIFGESQGLPQNDSLISTSTFCRDLHQ